ncbi:hypothetical protein HAX54_038325, partial [Datura stramonium]|nr:hypothetical protein [Datura stramonium]
ETCVKKAALPPGEVENIFTEVNNDIDYTNAIVPPRVNAPTFKIDERIYNMLKDPSHGFPQNILLEKFYTGLDPFTRSMANNVARGCFMDKTYNRIATILDRIIKHNQAWHASDQSGGIHVGSPSMTHLMKENQEHDQLMTAMTTNITLLTMKLT